jgi:hypothetical protein
MRFDLEALRQALSLKISSSANLPAGMSAVAAAGGAAVALATVAYVAWPAAPEVPADAVVVEGPVFTPVAMTPAASVPVAAERPSAPNEPARSESRFNDTLNVTRAVQRQLKRAGCYDGPVNGVWNVPTRNGMAAFTERVNAQLPVDRADPVLLVLLETHNTTSCTGDAPARTEERRTDERREVTRVSVDAEEAVAAGPRAEDLGYSAERQRAPNPITAVQTASTEPATDGGSFGAGEAAALTAAGAVAYEVTKKQKKPRHATRKYRKKNSFSRSVSKGFRQIQRSLNKLF